VGTAGGNDVFVAKLTAAGAHVWSAGFGDASDQATFGVSIDGSGNVVVVGSMFGTVDFGGGPLVANGLDLFLASFTSAGAHGWSQVFDGTFTLGVGILVTVALDTGPSGEVAIAGEMRSTVDFGGGMLTSAGFSDMYIAAFDATGAHQWSALYGSAGGSEKAQSLRIDGSGNLITSGIFGADTDFGGGTLSIVAGTTVFAALYDASGAHLFSSGYGSYVYECYSHVDVNGDYLLHSSAYSDIDFGGGPITGNPVIAKFEGAGGTASSIGDTPGASGLSLAAYPNPFNPTTRISYTLDQPGSASLSVYDVRGRRIETMVPTRYHDRGSYSIPYAARGASGVYFLRLQTRFGERTIKIVELK